MPPKTAVVGTTKGRYDKETRISVYATDDEGTAAIEWAQERWRTWECDDPEHERPRSASTLLRDLLVHAMREDRVPKKRSRR